MGTDLGTVDTSVNETKSLPSRNLYSSMGGQMIKTISKCIICQMMLVLVRKRMYSKGNRICHEGWGEVKESFKDRVIFEQALEGKS